MSAVKTLFTNTQENEKENEQLDYRSEYEIFEDMYDADGLFTKSDLGL
jgi:hypothetical protein